MKSKQPHTTDRSKSLDHCKHTSTTSLLTTLHSLLHQKIYFSDCSYIYRLNCEEKNDVYDFGVILLELIVGRTLDSLNDVNISKDIVSRAREISLINFISKNTNADILLQQLSVSLTADAMGRRSILDPLIHKECSDESVKTLIELCSRCLSNEAHERPSMEDAVWNLQFAAQVQDTWQRDSTSSQNSPLHHHDHEGVV